MTARVRASSSFRRRVFERLEAVQKREKERVKSRERERERRLLLSFKALLRFFFAFFDFFFAFFPLFFFSILKSGKNFL